MVSFNDIIKKKAEEHKMENEIPEEYECVKLDEILDKEFTVDIANVYIDNKSDDKRKKVALAITMSDGKKYRVHTGGVRIVEIFEAIQENNKNPENEKINVSEGKHTIKSIVVGKGNMLIFE